MARKPVGYWEKRSTELMKSVEKNTEYTINDLIKIYNNATININKEIETIFKNFGKHGVLEKDVLKQLLNKRETEVHYKNMLKVINENIKDENLKKKLLTKYNAPAYAYRISRLQELQDNINMEMYKLAELEQNITESRYIKTIDEAYYHTIYDIQKGTGYAFSFSHLNTNTLNLMLANKWIDNKNYSQRIWNNTEKLGRYLKTNLTADIITGKSVQKISKNLSEYMNVGTYNATRLVRTEVNHFANESEALAYEECEIEKYQFIATLDNRTCDKCASLDNRVFNVKDRKTGVNYPPMHANDRCTTVAYFDDDTKEKLKRRARNPVTGRTYIINDDISYNEWRKSIDEKYGNGTFEKTQKMYKNEKYDKEQYKKYKNVIGKDNLPSTFAKYQEMKYNNSSEYDLLKSYYQQFVKNSFPADMKYSVYKNNLTTDKWQAVGFNPNYAKSHEKHLKEFNNISFEEYESKAKNFLNSNDKNIERFISKEGTHFAYNSLTNEFALARANGVTQTYFLPKKKEEYWKEQKEKYGKKN